MRYIPTSSGYETEGYYEEIIYDVVIIIFLGVKVEEQLNEVAQKFYDHLKVTKWPSWEGFNTHTKLSMKVRMLSIKINWVKCTMRLIFPIYMLIEGVMLSKKFSS